MSPYYISLQLIIIKNNWLASFKYYTRRSELVDGVLMAWNGLFSEVQRLKFKSPFSMEEAKWMVFQCNGGKAPSSYCFIFAFYQEC